MKLKYVDGCICTSLSVDDVESIDMNPEDFRKVIHQLVDKVEDFAVLQDLFTNCMESLGYYHCSEHACDCCGDYITTYTYEL